MTAGKNTLRVIWNTTERRTTIKSAHGYAMPTTPTMRTGKFIHKKNAAISPHTVRHAELKSFPRYRICHTVNICSPLTRNWQNVPTNGRRIPVARYTPIYTNMYLICLTKSSMCFILKPCTSDTTNGGSCVSVSAAAEKIRHNCLQTTSTTHISTSKKKASKP